MRTPRTADTGGRDARAGRRAVLRTAWPPSAGAGGVRLAATNAPCHEQAHASLALVAGGRIWLPHEHGARVT